MAAPSPALLTVRELLGVPSLRLRLIEGAAGLDRPIRWAHSTDLLDPRRYLRGGELVLTVGSTLQDPAACRSFVDALVEVQASGIGLGIGNFHAETPRALRLACSRHALPLLEVPFEVPFLSIVEFLAERLVARRSADMLQRRRREARILAALESGQGLEGVVHVLSRESGLGVVVTGTEGTLEACAGPSRLLADATASVAAAVAGCRPGATTTRAMHDGVTCELVAVRHRRQRIGWVGWLREDRVADVLPLQDLHEIAPLISLALAARAGERAHERRATGRLLDLVKSGVADPVALSDRIAAAGLDPRRLVASAWHTEAAEALRALEPEAVVGEHDEGLYALVDGDQDLGAFALGRGLVAGLGSPVPIRALATSLHEADAALELARPGRAITSWRDLASVPVLLEQQPEDRTVAFANQLIVPLFSDDQRGGGALVDSLRTFIAADGAVEATARSLHIHPNTLRHRLRRIRTLSGHDPLRFFDRMALYVGLWAWDNQVRGGLSQRVLGPDATGSHDASGGTGRTPSPAGRGRERVAARDSKGRTTTQASGGSPAGAHG